MKRAKTILWTTVGINIALFIISIIIGDYNIFYIPLLIMFFGSIVITVIEFRIISIRTKPYFINENYTGAIEYTNSIIYKCFMILNVYSCVITLVISYMLVGETDKVIYLLEKYEKMRKNRNLLYIQMIILISENRITEARRYQKRLLNLRFKKYNNQKDTSVQIFEMIESKRFDENIYNTTKYPLLKTICLRYKNDGVDRQENVGSKKLLNIDQIKQPHKSSVAVKLFSALLNILSSLTIFAALIVIGTKIATYDTITSIEGLYYSLKTMWVVWLFLPISLGCLLFGLVFKKRNYQTDSNIVIGVIFSFLLFIFGSMHFLGLKQYSTDTEYLYNIEDTIQVDFPSDITIITQDWTKGEQTSSDNNYYKYTSVVRFYNDTEVLTFENSINDNYWVDVFSEETIDFLPKIFTVETYDYDKFLLYCYESKEYNPETNTSKYNYICIAYSKENKSLIIYEFSIK